jgi:hypothetical protein
MTRLCCLRPSVRIRYRSRSSIRHAGATSVTKDEVRLARLTAGPLSNLTGPFSVRSKIDKKEDLFWIRNRFQILVRKSVPDLGSEYGNKPYRSFREQTIPSSCPRNRAQHQRVRQYASQRPLHSSGDCTLLLLRGRPGRRVVSLRSQTNCDGNRSTLMPVGRLSNRRGGQ